MTGHTDRDDLRDAAEGQLRYGGNGDYVAEGVLALLDALDQAEARIKAVRDVLGRRPYEDRRGNVVVSADDIRRALDGDSTN